MTYYIHLHINNHIYICMKKELFIQGIIPPRSIYNFSTCFIQCHVVNNLYPILQGGGTNIAIPIPSVAKVPCQGAETIEKHIVDDSPSFLIQVMFLRGGNWDQYLFHPSPYIWFSLVFKFFINDLTLFLIIKAM